MYLDFYAKQMMYLFVFAVVVGMAIMAAFVWLIPWLWELLKPWLHMITA